MKVAYGKKIELKGDETFVKPEHLEERLRCFYVGVYGDDGELIFSEHFEYVGPANSLKAKIWHCFPVRSGIAPGSTYSKLKELGGKIDALLQEHFRNPLAALFRDMADSLEGE